LGGANAEFSNVPSSTYDDMLDVDLSGVSLDYVDR